MKLTEKLKKIPKVVLFSAAVLSASVGCATPWQTMGVEYESTGIERKVIINETPKKVEEIEFKISEPYFANGYNVQIKESKNEINSKIKVIGSKNELEKVLIEEREVPDKTKMGSDFTTGIVTFGILGAGVGSFAGLVGLLKDSDMPLLTGLFAGGSVGMVFGSVIGGIIVLADYSRIKQTRRTKTNETKEELSNYRRSEEIDLGKNSIYQDKPASDISVKLTGEGRDKMYTTDSEGELNLSYFLDSLSPSYFFRNYTDRKLLKRIERIPLIQQIKPKIRSQLIEDSLDEIISKKDLRLRVETNETSTSSKIVKNSSRTFNLEGSQVTDGAIYGMVRQFVNEEINSHIKSLTFIVKDNVTHVPINGSNFEFRLNAPQKDDLAGKYFTQELKKYAKKYIRDYLEGNTMIGGVPNIASYNIYSPSRIQVEVTNPDYNFVFGVIDIKDKDVEKKVYMKDKGRKVRVQDADNERGRIE